MKKNIILALLLLSIAPASAQVWLGGELGLSINDASSTIDDRDYTSTMQRYTFSPKVGYDLNDHFAVGLHVGFSYSFFDNSRTSGGQTDESSYTDRVLSLFPFVRYSFAEWHKVRFFVDGGVGYDYTFNGASTYSPQKRYYAALKPGITYPLNDRFGLIAHLGELSYSRTEIEKSDPYNEFNFNLINDLQFGFFVRL